MGEVGCYTMDLYCDDPRHGHHDPDVFTGPSRRYCVKAARRAGWLINPRGEPNPGPTGQGSGRCVCPAHNGKRGRKRP